MPTYPTINFTDLPDWVPPLDTGKPSAEDLNKLPGQTIGDVAGSDVAIPIVYGTDRVRGRLICYFMSSTGRLVGAWAFCQGEIDGYESVLVDGIDVDDEDRGVVAAGASYTLYTGSQSQTVDPSLQAAALASGATAPFTDTYAGTAYMVMSIPEGATQGFPRVEAIVRGRKVHDPRLTQSRLLLESGDRLLLESGDFLLLEATQDPDDESTWAYSDNPTLCFADFIVNFAGQEVDWDSVIENADANDIELAPGHPHRRIGLTLSSPASVDQWIKAWRVYMGCFIAREKGKIRLIPERADVPPPWGAQFPGVSGSAIVIGDNSAFDFGAGESFEIEISFRSGTVAVTQTLLSKRASLVSGAGWSLSLDPSGNLLFVASDGGAGTNFQYAVGPYNDGVWHVVSVAYDVTGNTITMLIDGVDVGSNSSFTVDTAGSLANSEDLLIGAVGPSRVNSFNGAIDEVRVWAGVRTPTQLAANRYREIDDPELQAALRGYWQINEYTGATVLDASATGANGTIVGAVSRTLGNTAIIPRGVVKHFTADDIIDNTLSLRHRPLAQSPTVVEVAYMDVSGSVWRTAVQSAESPGVALGTEPRRVSRVQLLGIHRQEQARREAIERLNWMLSDLEGSFQCADIGLRLQQGSIIAVSHPIGLTAKLFRVRRLSALRGRWTVEVAEYDPRIYSDEVLTTPSTPDTLLPDPARAPAVTGLTAAEQLFRYRTGLWGSRIRVEWEAPTFYPYTIQRYLVEWYADVDGNGTLERVFQAYVSNSPATSPPVEDYVNDQPVTFQVKVYAETAYGTGIAAQTTAQVLGKLLPPGNVPAVRAVLVSSKAVDIDWDPADDIDIWRYEVRYAVGTLSAVGAAAPVLGADMADVTEPIDVVGYDSASALDVVGFSSDEVGVPEGTAYTYPDWDTATFASLVDGLNITLRNLPVGRYRVYLKAVDSVRQRSPLPAFVDFEVMQPAAPTELRGLEAGGDIRLSWVRSASQFVVGYRVEWRTSPGGAWTFLEEVDATKTIIPGFQQGAYDFRVFALDDQRVLSDTAPEVTVNVTSDEAAYSRDIYEFVNPTYTPNLANWNLVEDGDPVRYWVTNMGDLFSDTDFQTYANEPLANYHSNGASSWVSETHDFTVPLTGNFVLTPDCYALRGSVIIAMYLSADGVGWDLAFGTAPAIGSQPIRVERRGTYRYCYVVFATSTTETLFLTSPSIQLKLEAQPYTELGQATTAVSGPTTVTTSRIYGVLRGINTQPINTSVFRTVVVDNIVFTSSATSFDLYAFDAAGNQVACDVAWSWTGI